MGEIEMFGGKNCEAFCRDSRRMFSVDSERKKRDLKER